MAKAKSRPTHAFKSLVAGHIIEENHTITVDNLRLIVEFNDFRKLDALESFIIGKKQVTKVTSN